MIETLEPKVGEGSFDREQPPLPPDERIADSLGRAVRSAALHSLAFVLIAIGIPIALLTSLRSEGLGSRGELIPVAIIAAAWLVMLRRSIPRWRALVHDRQDGRIAFVDGAVWIEARPSPGIVPLMRYRLHVAHREFDVSREVATRVNVGARYRVWYAPRAGVFLHAHEAAALHTETATLGVGVSSLTKRETEILALIADGRSNKEIGAALHLSVNTIKMHTTQLYKKLGATRRTEAVARARALGAKGS